MLNVHDIRYKQSFKKDHRPEIKQSSRYNPNFLKKEVTAPKYWEDVDHARNGMILTTRECRNPKLDDNSDLIDQLFGNKNKNKIKNNAKKLVSYTDYEFIDPNKPELGTQPIIRQASFSTLVTQFISAVVGGGTKSHVNALGGALGRVLQKSTLRNTVLGPLVLKLTNLSNQIAGMNPGNDKNVLTNQFNLIAESINQILLYSFSPDLLNYGDPLGLNNPKAQSLLNGFYNAAGIKNPRLGP